MKWNSHILHAALCAALCFFGVSVSAQEPGRPDMLSQAEQEADRLQRLLDLDDWQVFYVDSTLKHNYPAMLAELEELSSAKVSNSSMYLAIQDKWMGKTDSAYMKLFTEEQWRAYLKSGAAKAQKARAKRAEKAGK
ncbi:MAG: hypothetical protein K2G18_05575 [Bacteroidales bacterium]|nr:hypothetical protein [Bacteroidales bacterium]